jgi:hypothetical protein
LENSRNICATTNRAQVSFSAHNGETLQSAPPLKARCAKKARKKGKHHTDKHG